MRPSWRPSPTCLKTTRSSAGRLARFQAARDSISSYGSDVASDRARVDEFLWLTASLGSASSASLSPSFRQSRCYTRCRFTASTPKPEGGARCVSSARRDLCGGRGEILVPTRDHSRFQRPRFPEPRTLTFCNRRQEGCKVRQHLARRHRTGGAQGSMWPAPQFETDCCNPILSWKSK